MQPQAFSEKYRPATLDAIVGQPAATAQLADFACQPFPQAFLFAGPTGIGKTTAALALVNELGVSRDFDFIHIKSGEMDAESVVSALSTVRRIGVRDGWKVILCDEADLMSTKARSLWLSALEDLQSYEFGKTVIVFTTNNPDRFDDRFRDRCEMIEFESDARTLHMDAEELLADLWMKEAMSGPVPSLNAVKGLVVDGAISFRRLVRFVEAESRRPVDLAAARKAKLAASRPIGLNVRRPAVAPASAPRDRAAAAVVL